MTDFIAKLSPLYADQVNWRAVSGTVEDLVDGGYDITIKPGDIIPRGPWVDVRSYGAVGDGVTDDSTAFQSAIDYAYTSGNHTVLIPGGLTYCIGTAIKLPEPTSATDYVNFHLIGLGKPVLKAKSAVNILTTYDVSTSPTYFTYGCSIENIDFDGASIGLNGILFWKPAHQTRIVNCTAHNFTQNGFCIKFPVNVYMVGCKGYDNTLAGLQSQGGSTLGMDHCYWSHNDSYGYHNAELTDTDQGTYNWTALGCIFENNSKSNLYVSAGPSDGLVELGHFETTGVTSNSHIDIDNDDSVASNPRNIRFLNCYFDSDPTLTFDIDNCNNIVFDNCNGGGTVSPRGTIGASASYTRIIRPRGINEFRPDIITNSGAYTLFEYSDYAKDEGGPSEWGPHWMYDRDNYVQMERSRTIRHVRSSATTYTLYTFVQDSGTHVLEAEPRFKIRNDGRLEWGAGGATATDCYLERGAADLIQTPDEFYSSKGLRTAEFGTAVSDPPTAAQLTAIFGDPATLGDGFIGVVNDGNADTDVWLCIVSNGSWFYHQLTGPAA